MGRAERAREPQPIDPELAADGIRFPAADSPHDMEVAGAASDLALFLWQRDVTGKLRVQGDASLLELYFVLVPRQPTVAADQFDLPRAALERASLFWTVQALADQTWHLSHPPGWLP